MITLWQDVVYGWEKRFNRDPNIIGQTLRVDGLDKTTVGVMQRHAT